MITKWKHDPMQYRVRTAERPNGAIATRPAIRARVDDADPNVRLTLWFSGRADDRASWSPDITAVERFDLGAERWVQVWPAPDIAAVEAKLAEVSRERDKAVAGRGVDDKPEKRSPEPPRLFIEGVGIVYGSQKALEEVLRGERPVPGRPPRAYARGGFVSGPPASPAAADAPEKAPESMPSMEFQLARAKDHQKRAETTAEFFRQEVEVQTARAEKAEATMRGMGEAAAANFGHLTVMPELPELLSDREVRLRIVEAFPQDTALANTYRWNEAYAWVCPGAEKVETSQPPHQDDVRPAPPVGPPPGPPSPPRPPGDRPVG